MPPWWTFRNWKELRALAMNPTGDYYIGHARKISDVRREWGYETSKVLRSLSFCVHNAIWDDNGRYSYGTVHKDRGGDDKMPACKITASGLILSLPSCQQQGRHARVYVLFKGNVQAWRFLLIPTLAVR
jgi:hypothetical protein